ncbi:MAG TPA: hypothetical protein VGD95_06330 [Micavibrio sp.]
MRKFIHRTRDHNAERGSALVYILIAIALLAALTVSFMEPSSQQGTSQNTFRTVSDIQSQVEFVRSAVQECVLTYSAGDSDITSNSNAPTEPNANPIYPINPMSGRYTGATLGPATTRAVAGLRCPGNPGCQYFDNGDPPSCSNEHALIFTGASGKFMPPAPALFGPWMWYNNTDGVFMWISTSKSDAYLRSALQKLDDEYEECEADFIDASSANQNLVSDDASIQCAQGSLCFRVRMLIRPSAVYNGDADNDEAACP